MSFFPPALTPPLRVCSHKTYLFSFLNISLSKFIPLLWVGASNPVCVAVLDVYSGRKPLTNGQWPSAGPRCTRCPAWTPGAYLFKKEFIVIRCIMCHMLHMLLRLKGSMCPLSLEHYILHQRIPHICYRHHRKCLCKQILSGVQFSRLKNYLFNTFWGYLL